MRAEHLIVGQVIRPHRRLLAVTFSKRARDNMAQRIQARLGYDLARRYVTVQNFHGLAARLVRAHGATLGVASDSIAPDKRWLSSTMAGLTNDWDARGAAETLLRELKSRPVDDATLAAQVHESGNQLAIHVEELRVAQNRLDYPDLLRHAQRLLLVPQIASLYQEHFDALVVDEFQDLSVQQLGIVSLACIRNSMFVGDPLQGIYSWAGASPDNVMAELASRCDQRVDLNISYRSSPEVLDVVNSVATPLGAAELKAADPASWNSTGRAYALEFATDVVEAESIAKLATHIHRRYPDESIGVIARAGYRRRFIDKAFADSDLPLQTWDMALDTPGILGTLRMCASGIRKDRPAEKQLETLRSRVAATVSEDDIETAAEMQEAIRILQEKMTAGESVRDALNRFKEIAVAEHVPPGVHLLNAHIGKGQQFDWVIVVGLEAGHVPSFKAKTDSEIQEEQRVLMVMLSRAKKGVVCTRARRTTNRFGLRAQTASPWWEDIARACATTTPELVALMSD